MLRDCLMASDQLALVARADAGQAARNDLAALGHEALQQAHVAVADRVDLLRAELADLLAAEELASARAAARTAGDAGDADRLGRPGSPDAVRRRSRDGCAMGGRCCVLGCVAVCLVSSAMCVSSRYVVACPLQTRLESLNIRGQRAEAKVG